MPRMQDYGVSGDLVNVALLGIDRNKDTKLFSLVTILSGSGYTNVQDVRDIVNQLITGNQLVNATGLNNAINSLLGGAGPAYDTLKELQDLITNDATAMAGLLTQVNNLTTRISNLETANQGQMDPIVAAIVLGG